MVRIIPLTYFVGGMASSSMGDTNITCSSTELVLFDPPAGLDCDTYLKEYMSYAGGSLLNHDAKLGCQFYPVANMESILGSLDVHFEDRRRDFGITITFDAFNIFGALFLYRAFRMSWKGTRAATS